MTDELLGGQHYEQKRLDSPELREQFLVDLRLLEERKTSPEWIATKYLALIPDTTGYLSPEEVKGKLKDAKQEVWTRYRSGHLTDLSIAVEEAKTQERERIFKMTEDAVEMIKDFGDGEYVCIPRSKWQALKDNE